MDGELERLREKVRLYRRLLKDTVDIKAIATLKTMAEELETEIATAERDGSNPAQPYPQTADIGDRPASSSKDET